MGKSDNTPKAPDYSAIANASQAAADHAYALGEDQLNWAKATYLADKQVTDQVVKQALQTQATNNANAAEDRARYKSIYQPLEDQAVADAQSYNTPERLQQDMGRAQANVAQQFDGQRSAAQQQLESFGIDPSSTRFAALDIGTRASQAAAEAAAGNQAAVQSEATGRALRADAINVGRGYPGQVANTYQTGINAGNQATNSQLATTASGSNSMNAATGFFNAGTNALNAGTGALNAGFNNSLAGYSAGQSSSSGLGSLLGSAAGAALSAYSSGLEDGGAVPGYDQGGAIPTGPMPQAPAGAAPGATPGGAIPVQASPSRGAIPDDVKANLTPDEFVVPRDVALWKGQEFFQKLIQQSRQQKQGAQAKPQAQPPLPGPTRFASRPGQPVAQAIPA